MPFCRADGTVPNKAGRDDWNRWCRWSRTGSSSRPIPATSALLKHHQKLLQMTILMHDVLVRHTCESDANGLRSVNCKEQTPDTGQAAGAGCGESWVGLHSGAAEKVTPQPRRPAVITALGHLLLPGVQLMWCLPCSVGPSPPCPWVIPTPAACSPCPSAGGVCWARQWVHFPCYILKGITSTFVPGFLLRFYSC